MRPSRHSHCAAVVCQRYRRTGPAQRSRCFAAYMAALGHDNTTGCGRCQRLSPRLRHSRLLHLNLALSAEHGQPHDGLAIADGNDFRPFIDPQP
jgi:hypothetical protein